ARPPLIESKLKRHNGLGPEIHRREDAMVKLITWATIVPLLSILTGCLKSSTAAKSLPPPPEVLVMRVQQRDVPIYNEWIGTLDGVVNADIKAQVSGYLERQDYTEGYPVKKGQLLFQIDPRPFQASLDQTLAQEAQSNGQLAQARAQLLQAEAQLAV